MNYRQIYARKAECEKRIKEVCPQATHESGIYCFTRVDEDGFKFAYVGLASKSLLTRLGEHLVGYQHIDLSIKKHGLYSQENPYGYKVDILCKCPAEECNEKEQYYIKKAADAGYQLKNSTTGSQGRGKKGLENGRPARGYWDGVSQGEKRLAQELKHIIDTHLVISLKKETKTSRKALEKFFTLLDK
jgi:hypothetical protein